MVETRHGPSEIEASHSLPPLDNYFSQHSSLRKVFLVGDSNIRQNLENLGMKVLMYDGPKIFYDEYDKYKLDPEVHAVVLSFSPDVTFTQLAIACLYINELKVPLLVTDDNPSKEIDGRKYPQAGAALAFVMAATGLGKPGSARCY